MTDDTIHLAIAMLEKRQAEIQAAIAELREKFISEHPPAAAIIEGFSLPLFPRKTQPRRGPWDAARRRKMSLSMRASHAMRKAAAGSAPALLTAAPKIDRRRLPMSLETRQKISLARRRQLGYAV